MADTATTPLVARSDASPDKSSNVANLVAFVINFVAVFAPQQFGKDNAQISGEHPTLVTPAGWAFSIWGVIFTSELAFALWQYFTAGGQSDLVKKGVGPWFVVACIVQAAWSIAFSQEQLVLAAILLVAIAVALGLAVVGLAPYKMNLLASVQSVEFWVVHFPIGLHAGWTCAAALVNISLALEGAAGSTKVAVLILTLVLSCLAGCFAVVLYHDQAYLCAIAWALAGVASRMDVRSAELSADVADGVNQALQYSWVGLLVVGAATAAVSMKK